MRWPLLAFVVLLELLLVILLMRDSIMISWRIELSGVL